MGEILPYPKWRYHALMPALIVQSAEDEAARTPDEIGWADSITEAAAKATPPSPPDPPDTVETADPPEAVPTDEPPVAEEPSRRPRRVK